MDLHGRTTATATGVVTPAVPDPVGAGLVADAQREVGARTVEGEHGVPVVALIVGRLASQCRPVGAADVLLAHLVGDRADGVDEVVGPGGAVVVQAVVHRRAVLGRDRAVAAVAQAGFEVVAVAPVVPLGVHERVVVHRQQGAVEAAVVADRPQVLAVTGAADEDPVGGCRVVVVEPAGREIAPLGGAVAVRLVHRFEVDLAIGAVGVGDRGPHGVERVHVVHPSAGGGPVLPVGEDDLEAPVGRGVDRAAVVVPPRVGDRVGVDGQSDGVGSDQALHVRVDGVGFGVDRVVAVVDAHPVQHQPTRGEVVAHPGPVEAPEVAGVRGRRRGAGEDGDRHERHGGQQADQGATERPPPTGSRGSCVLIGTHCWPISCSSARKRELMLMFTIT